jgi:hypothetical protein
MIKSQYPMTNGGDKGFTRGLLMMSQHDTKGSMRWL